MFHANEGGGREEERIEESEELRIIGKSIRDQPREQKCVMSIVTVDRCLSFFERIAKKKAVPNKKKSSSRLLPICWKISHDVSIVRSRFFAQREPTHVRAGQTGIRNAASLKC